MDRIERLGQESPRLAPDDDDRRELRGHHERGGPGGLPVVPSVYLRSRILEGYPHGPFHETPDHQGQDQNQPERLDTPRRLEKQGVDEHRVLEKSEIALDGMLILIGHEQLFGAQSSCGLFRLVAD